nr:NADH dehydrogenase subunit 6 [Trochus sp. n. CL-2022]
MTSLLIMSLGLSSTFLFPLMSQPLSLGLMIMISTLLLCSMTALMISSWYGYILFLIYVGGLLVMFAYVAALSPNVLFGGMGPLAFLSLSALILGGIFYFYSFLDFGSLAYFSDFSSLKEMKTHGSQLVGQHSSFILVSLGIILLINLIVVVKICYYQHASLRPFKETYK